MGWFADPITFGDYPQRWYHDVHTLYNASVCPLSKFSEHISSQHILSTYLLSTQPFNTSSHKSSQHILSSPHTPISRMRDLIGDRLPQFTPAQKNRLIMSYDYFAFNHYTSKYFTDAGSDVDTSSPTENDLSGNDPVRRSVLSNQHQHTLPIEKLSSINQLVSTTQLETTNQRTTTTTTTTITTQEVVITDPRTLSERGGWDDDQMTVEHKYNSTGGLIGQ